MNNQDIFKALRHIDQRLILDAAPRDRRRHNARWLRWGSVAACVCLLVAGVLMLGQHGWRAGEDGLDHKLEHFIVTSYVETGDAAVSDAKPQFPLIVTADAPVVLHREKSDIVQLTIGLATIKEYTGAEDESAPARTELRIDADGLMINGQASVYTEEHDITKEQYRCATSDPGEHILGTRYPTYFDKYTLDFSAIPSGQTGVIEVWFTQYHEYSHGGAVVRIYYAADEDHIVFSTESTEKAAERLQ
ncbi:MAG: hypothetical protein IJW40_01985 [Clostridia bacterium]|nr:hypothetical protein [Clostridia bacterium]